MMFKWLLILYDMVLFPCQLVGVDDVRQGGKAPVAQERISRCVARSHGGKALGKMHLETEACGMDVPVVENAKLLRSLATVVVVPVVLGPPVVVDAALQRPSSVGRNKELFHWHRLVEADDRVVGIVAAEH